jgi:hypothetical protein
MGGRQFDCLETLVSYYMFYSELIEGEKIQYPIAPNLIERIESTYISIKPYLMKKSNQKYGNQIKTKSKLVSIQMSSSSTSSSFNESSDLDLENDDEIILYFERVGEIFRVFHQVGEQDEWYWAQRYDTNEYGLLLADCVKQVVLRKFLFLVVFNS